MLLGILAITFYFFSEIAFYYCGVKDSAVKFQFRDLDVDPCYGHNISDGM
jgi:hypothetical protein